MTYQVLARKYRPATFDEVVGQDAITRTLRNALASGRIAHAYLFAGPRGIGKTTTARLLARALLCPERKAAPSRAARARRALDAAASVDIIEIDAASNRGIDDIRTLRENVKYAPARGRYKVYIIDEVHQLTERRVRRAAQDAGGAAAARRLRAGHHRSARPAGHRCSRACSASTSGRSRPI